MNKQWRQIRVIGSLSVSVLLASLGTSMANIALPAVAAEFNSSFGQVRWVVTAYLVSSTLLSLVIGRLGDLKGRRSILLLGTALFAFGTLLCASSLSLGVLIFARGLQGIGGAALIVLPLALVPEFLPKEKMGRAIGWLATMSAIGTAGGPSLGGFILGQTSWRAAFVLMTILAGLNFLLLFQSLPHKSPGDRFNSERSSFLQSLNAVWHSSTRVALVFNFVVSAIMMATLIAGPFFLSHDLHLSPGRMGLVMSAGPLTSILAGLISGFVVDRYGSEFVVRIGTAQLLIGTLAFALLPLQFGAAGFVLAAVMLSLGYQLFLAANSNSVMKSVADDQRGLVSGALSLSRNSGLVAGTVVMGGIFDLFGLQITFLFAASLMVLLLIQNLTFNKRRSNGFAT